MYRDQLRREMKSSPVQAEMEGDFPECLRDTAQGAEVQLLSAFKPDHDR